MNTPISLVRTMGFWQTLILSLFLLAFPAMSLAGEPAVPDPGSGSGPKTVDASAPSPSTVELALPAAPQGADDPDKDWHVVWYPGYIWFTGFAGSVGAGNQIAEVDAKFTDIADEINLGYMTALDVRHRRIGVLFDFNYADLGDSKAAPRDILYSSASVDTKQVILSPELYFRVLENKRGSLDLTGGLRYWHLENDLKLHGALLPDAIISSSDDWADAIFGMRSRVNLDEEGKWFIPFKTDFGAGGSDFTWHVFGGIGRNIGKRSVVTIGYRHLDVDRRAGGKVFDVGIGGFLLGVGLSF